MLLVRGTVGIVHLHRIMPVVCALCFVYPFHSVHSHLPICNRAKIGWPLTLGGSGEAGAAGGVH
jgi:hypothetical protein